MKDQVGHLRFNKQLTPEVIRATCSVCDYPVLVSSEDWGSVFGCSRHHEEWVIQRDQEEAEEAKAQADAKRAREDHAKRVEANINPHFDTLDASQRHMIVVLESHPNFSIDTLAKTFGLDNEEAWEELLLLADANVIIELGGPFLEPRPYDEWTPYSQKASPASRYKLRPLALKQRKELGWDPEDRKVESLTPQDKEQVVDPLGQLEDFLLAKCRPEAGATVKQSELRFEYFKWAKDNGLREMSNEQFNLEVERAFQPDKFQRWVGVRLKRPSEFKQIAIEQVVNPQGVQTGAIELRV